MAEARMTGFSGSFSHAVLAAVLSTIACGPGAPNPERNVEPRDPSKIRLTEHVEVEPSPTIQVPSEMVLVPGAHVRFERTDDSEAKSIAVESFMIDRLEATVAEYLACREAGACTSAIVRMPECNALQKSSRLEHPVNCISWHEAHRFCAWRSKRLPTAAEWELAARGLNQRHYPWGNALPSDQLCWQGRKKHTRDTTCPVGSFPNGASPYGVLDMAGNVAEWTSTILEGVYPQPVYDTRGGGYAWEELDRLAPDDTPVRGDKEGGLNASSWDPQVGVRCARSLDQAK